MSESIWAPTADLAAAEGSAPSQSVTSLLQVYLGNTATQSQEQSSNISTLQESGHGSGLNHPIISMLTGGFCGRLEGDLTRGS